MNLPDASTRCRFARHLLESIASYTLQINPPFQELANQSATRRPFVRPIAPMEKFVLGLSPQQIFFLLILIAAIVLFVSEWIRTDIVAVMIVIALYATRVLSAEDALSGFSSEPAIVVAGIFVLSCSLHATGFSDTIGQWIGRLAGSSFTRAISVIMS